MYHSCLFRSKNVVISARCNHRWELLAAARRLFLTYCMCSFFVSTTSESVCRSWPACCCYVAVCCWQSMCWSSALGLLIVTPCTYVIVWMMLSDHIRAVSVIFKLSKCLDVNAVHNFVIVYNCSVYMVVFVMLQRFVDVCRLSVWVSQQTSDSCCASDLVCLASVVSLTQNI